MQMLHNNLKSVVIYTNLGYQPRENVYVIGNKKIFVENQTIEDYPKLPDDLHLTEEETLQILPANSLAPELYECENPEIILEEFAETVIKTFDAPVLMAIAVIIGCCFFDIFISNVQGFPYVIFYGDSNAGKSTIIHMLAAIFGITNMTELTSGTSTIVALRAQLEKMNDFPVFIEELDEKRIQNIEDLGKDVFSAVPRKKSSKDGKEIVTEINTSFCIGTNHFFETLTFANFSRCIPINLRRRQFDLSNFEYHSKEALKKLSCFLPKILFYRDKILDFYREQYRIAKIHCDYARICNNVAIGMAIWSIINDILKKEVLNTENLVKDYLDYFEPYLDTEISYCDVLLSDVYNLFNKKELLYGREFLITKGKYLRINLNKYCTVYQSVYHKKLHPNEIKIKIANDERVISLKTTDIKPIGRAIKIDISDNETLLDILNRVSKTAEDEEADYEETP